MLSSPLVANEAFKFVTEVSDNMDNFFMNNGTVGNYSLTVSHERSDDCIVCNTKTFEVAVAATFTVEDFIEFLKEDARFQLRNPSFSRNAGAPIYFANREDDQSKLPTLLQEHISSGDELLITDPTYPSPVLMQVRFEN